MVGERTKVMIVEDNPGDARLLQETFHQHSTGEFEQVYEPNLEGALKRLAAEKVDLILLDLFLPETFGLETLGWIQKADPQASIVVLTGSNDGDMAAKALERGAAGYLVKDTVEGEDLIRTLHSVAGHNARGAEGPQALSAARPAAVGKRPLPWDHGNGEAGPMVGSHDGLLAQVLERERVEVHFQPWVSLKRQSIIGVEGLCRVGDPQEPVSPLVLLKRTGSPRLLADLDHLFRRKVFGSFESVARQDTDLLLSVNFEASVLNHGGNDFNLFLSLAHEHHLDPGRIVIEIRDSPDCDLALLKKFIEDQRSLGFLIALDGVELGLANLDRVAELRPDFIKTHLSMVTDMERSHCAKEMFKSVVELATGIGAFVIVQGVETEAEVLSAMKLGAHMIQGYYFGEPGRMRGRLMAGCKEKIDKAVGKYKRFVSTSIEIKRSCYREYSELLYRMGREVAPESPHNYDGKLVEIIQRHPHLECLFILDEEGKQITHRISNRYHLPHGKMVFKAMNPGTDHSMNEYYYYPLENLGKEFTYFSEPYLSQSTWKRCITISSLFKDAAGKTYVLCVEVKPEHLLIQC